jgi:hypothetical protein
LDRLHGGNMRAEWAIAIAAVDGLFGSMLAIGSHVEVNASAHI